MAIDFHGFPVTIAWHEEALARCSKEFIQGRNLYDGYLRSMGLHFGNLAEPCIQDPVFIDAYTAAKKFGTPLSDQHLCNLYLILRRGLEGTKGHFAEFGVHKGGSAFFLATVAKHYHPHATVYCFDSFQGMPPSHPDHDMHKEADFNDASFPLFLEEAGALGLSNIEGVKGFFQDSLPQHLPTIQPLAFIHIDADLYEAVRDCYLMTKPYMLPRSYLVFDDAGVSSCIGAFDAVARHVIQEDGKLPEQTWPQLVFRS